MGLPRYVLRRVLLAIPMLFGITLVLFIMYNLTRVDPIVMIVGERQLNNAQIVDAARERWGLNRPPWEQYFTYIGNYLRGDLGMSFLTHRPVVDDLVLYLPATLELGVMSLIF